MGIGVTALALLLASLSIQGCRRERMAEGNVPPGPLVASAAASPAAEPANPVPVTVPDPESSPETNWVEPGSTNLPDDVTLASSASRAPVRSHSAAPVKVVSRIRPDRAATTVYLVRPGDTLARIARSQGVSVKSLKAANHLKNDQISTGEKLRIPLPNLAAVDPTRP